MAASRKLTNDFLSCLICTEVFQDPCTLHCEHSFCRSCLSRHIKAQPRDLVQSGYLACPFCPRSTPVEGTGEPVEEWIASLKPSRLIQGLMASLVPKTEEIEDCAVCRHEGETNPATVWCPECDSALCGSCLQMHQRMPLLRHHNITVNSAEVNPRRRQQKFVCKEHGKKIKMFCKDCHRTLCTLCCSLDHRLCTDVVTTQSMLEEVKQAMTKKQTLFSERIRDISAYISKTKLMIEDKEEDCDKTKQTISTAVDGVVKTLLDKKKQLIAEVSEELNKHIDIMKAKVKLGEMDIQVCQQKTEFIVQALERESEEGLFRMYREHEKRRNAFDDNRGNELPIHGDVQFKHELHKVEKLICEMKVATDHGIDFGIIPTLHSTLDCKIGGDKFSPLFRDVMAISAHGVDVIVVTDWNNIAIRLFYEENNKSCHGTLKCESGPWSLALVKRHEAIATVPGCKQIIMFDINPKPVWASTIRTGKCYYGIDVLNPSSLVASSPYSTPPSVDILDFTGQVVKTFTELGSILNSVKSPYFVHVTFTGNILISDAGNETLTCITPEGEVVFVYKPTGENRLNDPRGVTTTVHGDILLADFVRNTIVHVSESGEFVRDIPIPKNTLQYVWGLCLKDTNLYVASSITGVMLFTYGAHRVLRTT